MTWSDSADKHGITRDEIVYAVAHATEVVQEFGEPRVGAAAPTLFIGPSRFGTLEVLVTITPPRDLHVFHAMPLRASTRAKVDQLRTEGRRAP